MMAGAPPSARGEPAFCIFIGYDTDVAADIVQRVIAKEALILLIVAMLVFITWRKTSEKVGIAIVVAAVILTTGIGHLVVRGFFDQKIKVEAERTARLAAVDFKIALFEGTPINTLKNVSLIKESLRDFLSRDPLALGLGIQIGPHFKYWEWQGDKQPKDHIMYGRNSLGTPVNHNADGEIIVAFPDTLSNVALLHSMTLVVILAIAALACSIFLVDATAHNVLGEKTETISPLVGTSFFFILVEELLRPALLLQLQQQISGLPQESALWFGLNVFWVCALWGTWASYRWFQTFPAARILTVCSTVMALSLLGQGSIHNSLYWIPLRGIEGYVFGLGLQSGIVFATRLVKPEQRFSALANLAQGALVATVIGPIMGGALTRFSGSTTTFYLAAGAAAIAAWLASRIAPDIPDKNTQSILSLLLAQGSRQLALPLLAMGMANRFVWFCTVGLLLPTIASSEPLGAAAVGELIGLLGLGMYIGRRYIDHRSLPVIPSLGWIANAIAAVVIGAGYATDISVWVWMPIALITGMALTIGSRAQQDWILSQPPSYASGLHGVSRLADRAGALLAGIVIPPLFGYPHLASSFALTSMVIILWLSASLYSAQRSSQ